MLAAEASPARASVRPAGTQYKERDRSDLVRTDRSAATTSRTWEHQVGTRKHLCGSRKPPIASHPHQVEFRRHLFGSRQHPIGVHPHQVGSREHLIGVHPHQVGSREHLIAIGPHAISLRIVIMRIVIMWLVHRLISMQLVIGSTPDRGPAPSASSDRTGLRGRPLVVGPEVTVPGVGLSCRRAHGRRSRVDGHRVLHDGTARGSRFQSRPCSLSSARRLRGSHTLTHGNGMFKVPFVARSAEVLLPE